MYIVGEVVYRDTPKPDVIPLYTRGREGGRGREEGGGRDRKEEGEVEKVALVVSMHVLYLIRRASGLIANGSHRLLQSVPYLPTLQVGIEPCHTQGQPLEQRLHECGVCVCACACTFVCI